MISNPPVPFEQSPAMRDARGIGERTGRNSRGRWVAATVAAAVVSLAGCGRAGVAGGLDRAGPTPSAEATAAGASAPSPRPTSPSAAPTSPPTGAAVTPLPIPVAALLTPADVGPGSQMGDVFDVPYAPNPFSNCNIDGYPHNADLVAALGTAISGPRPYSTVGDSVLAFRQGAAHAVMTGISDLLTGDCGGHFTAVGQDLGGDESILLRGEDAQPGNAGAQRIAYYAVIRRGDRVAWLVIVDYASRADFAAYARTLAARAAQRMCAPIRC